MPGLDFLDGADAPQLDTPAIPDVPAEAVTVEATPEPQEAPSGPVRGPDGKFVAREATAPQEPAQAPQPEPAPQQNAEDAPVTRVGLTHLLEEREKRQTYERRVQELEAQLQQITRQQQPQDAAEPPDPYEDPEGYHSFVQQQIASATLNTRLDISEEMTRGKHGDEVVNQARDWGLARMGQSPAFRQEVLSHRNPYEFLVQQHQRDTLISGLQPDEFEQFRAWKASQGQGAPPAPAQAAPQPPVIPQAPRSLASATSAGNASAVPIGPGNAYDGIFSQG